ncbi:MAG: O-antigen ligase family protein [Desulfoplanes sp.]|nr:O-antigen ligase family protein [Desulfoplanes sp.]MDD4649487.1 O-antigen ligase family protein [Desulfoplanes sp.]
MMFLPLSLTASFLVYACIGKIVPGENLRLLTHGPNVLGMLAGYSILIYLGNLNDMTRKQKWLFFPPAILIPSILMVLSGSRGAFIALAASVFLCACMYRAWKTILVSVVILMAGMLFLSTTHLKNYQIDRLKQGVLHPLQQLSFQARQALWETAWAGFKKKPVFGSQMSNFKKIFHDYRQKNYTILRNKYTYIDTNEVYHPHNLYLGILFGWGCIGGIAFIITTGATLLIAKKNAFIFPLIILFYNAIFGISGFNLHRKDGAYTFFLIYGLTIGRYYLAKKVQYESTS